MKPGSAQCWTSSVPAGTNGPTPSIDLLSKVLRLNLGFQASTDYKIPETSSEVTLCDVDLINRGTTWRLRSSIQNTCTALIGPDSFCLFVLERYDRVGQVWSGRAQIRQF